MIGKHSGQVESKEVFYECMEAFALEKIREWVQDLLEQEVMELLGRNKSERKASEVEQPGYRNGYGKPRRFTLSMGTVGVRRPRVRNLDERFISKVLPLFKRQTKQVRDLIVCRGSGATCRLKSGPGNYRYTPVAKIRFVGRPTRLSGSRKLFIREDCKLAGRTTREPIEPRDCKMRVPTLWSDGEGRCHL